MKKYFAGIDLGGTKFATILATEDGNVLSKVKHDTLVSQGAETVINRMMDSIQEILEQNQVELGQLKAIGLGIPGILNTEEGICIDAFNLGWSGVQVLEPFRSRFNVPVFMENDVRVATLGEYKYGAGKEYKNFTCITIGTGISSGIVLDGKLFSGPTESGGELGHITMIPDGDPCPCGSFGCLETYASARGMSRTAQKYITGGRISLLTEMVEGDLDKITPKTIVEAYDKGDEVAIDVLQQAIKLLSIAISNYVNLLNFELVIIGGGVSNMGDRLLEGIKKYLVYPRIPKPAEALLKVVRAELGEEAGMYGAIALAMEKIKG